jgi:hypothetical protein
MLEGMGIRTRIKLDKLCEASRIAVQGLGRVPTSRYLQAWMTKNLSKVP